MGIFRRAQPPEALSSAMAGVKLGDRVLFAGTDDVGLPATLARRAGLSGRVVLLAPDGATASARAARIETAGALVDPEHAPLTMLPFDGASFDVAVAEETLIVLGEFDRRAAIVELLRVLRPGGRLLWIEREPRGGLFRMAPDSRGLADKTERERMLTEAGFRGVRTLASAEGRTYTEGIKSASSNS